MSRLFTRTALERTARIALTKYILHPEHDPERLIAEAVALVATDSPPLYDQETVRSAVIATLRRLRQEERGTVTETDEQFFAQEADRAVQDARSL